MNTYHGHFVLLTYKKPSGDISGRLFAAVDISRLCGQKLSLSFSLNVEEFRQALPLPWE